MKKILKSLNHVKPCSESCNLRDDAVTVTYDTWCIWMLSRGQRSLWRAVSHWLGVLWMASAWSTDVVKRWPQRKNVIWKRAHCILKGNFCGTAQDRILSPPHTLSCSVYIHKGAISGKRGAGDSNKKVETRPGMKTSRSINIWDHRERTSVQDSHWRGGTRKQKGKTSVNEEEKPTEDTWKVINIVKSHNLPHICYLAVCCYFYVDVIILNSATGALFQRWQTHQQLCSWLHSCYWGSVYPAFLCITVGNASSTPKVQTEVHTLEFSRILSILERTDLLHNVSYLLYI